jgi:phenylacetate-CoA ligase
MPFHQPPLETISRDELHALQLTRLRETVRHVHAHNRRYAERLRGLGVDEVRSLADLTQFPFLTKDDLRQAYPFALTCAPPKDFVRIQTSSGTTGTPVLNAYTAADVAQWSEIMARCLSAATITAEDVIQITPSFGMFNGGFGFHFGASAIGALIIPIGAGRTPFQLDLMRDLGTTALAAIASYPLRLMEVARALHFDFRKQTKLRVGVFGAETWSDGIRRRIESEMGIETFDIIGMTETGGVGMGIDCEAHNGVHVWEDHYLVEIIDPTSGAPLPDGERGEMVITTLTRRGLPLIRFRTGDITSIMSREPCACGRTHLRVERLTGRTDDMLKVKGVNFYPRQIEAVLLRYDDVASDYQIVVDKVAGKDEMRLVIEAPNPQDRGLAQLLDAAIFDVLGFHADVQLVSIGAIERPVGKAVRVVDNRKKTLN